MLNELKFAYIAAKPYLKNFGIKLARSIAEGVIITVATKYANRAIVSSTYSENDKDNLERVDKLVEVLGQKFSNQTNN